MVQPLRLAACSMPVSLGLIPLLTWNFIWKYLTVVGSPWKPRLHFYGFMQWLPVVPCPFRVFTLGLPVTHCLASAALWNCEGINPSPLHCCILQACISRVKCVRNYQLGKNPGFTLIVAQFFVCLLVVVVSFWVCLFVWAFFLLKIVLLSYNIFQPHFPLHPLLAAFHLWVLRRIHNPFKVACFMLVTPESSVEEITSLGRTLGSHY